MSGLPTRVFTCEARATHARAEQRVRRPASLPLRPMSIRLGPKAVPSAPFVPPRCRESVNVLPRSREITSAPRVMVCGDVTRCSRRAAHQPASLVPAEKQSGSLTLYACYTCQVPCSSQARVLTCVCRVPRSRLSYLVVVERRRATVHRSYSTVAYCRSLDLRCRLASRVLVHRPYLVGGRSVAH